MYADDLALVAESPQELQAMLNIMHSYAGNGGTILMRTNPSSWSLESLPVQELKQDPYGNGT